MSDLINSKLNFSEIVKNLDKLKNSTSQNTNSKSKINIDVNYTNSPQIEQSTIFSLNKINSESIFAPPIEQITHSFVDHRSNRANSYIPELRNTQSATAPSDSILAMFTGTGLTSILVTIAESVISVFTNYSQLITTVTQLAQKLQMDIWKVFTNTSMSNANAQKAMTEKLDASARDTAYTVGVCGAGTGGAEILGAIATAAVCCFAVASIPTTGGASVALAIAGISAISAGISSVILLTDGVEKMRYGIELVKKSGDKSYNINNLLDNYKDLLNYGIFADIFGKDAEKAQAIYNIVIMAISTICFTAEICGAASTGINEAESVEEALNTENNGIEMQPMGENNLQNQQEVVQQNPINNDDNLGQLQNNINQQNLNAENNGIEMQPMGENNLQNQQEVVQQNIIDDNEALGQGQGQGQNNINQQNEEEIQNNINQQNEAQNNQSPARNNLSLEEKIANILDSKEFKRFLDIIRKPLLIINSYISLGGMIYKASKDPQALEDDDFSSDALFGIPGLIFGPLIRELSVLIKSAFKVLLDACNCDNSEEWSALPQKIFELLLQFGVAAAYSQFVEARLFQGLEFQKLSPKVRKNIAYLARVQIANQLVPAVMQSCIQADYNFGAADREKVSVDVQYLAKQAKRFETIVNFKNTANAIELKNDMLESISQNYATFFKSMNDMIKQNNRMMVQVS